MAKGRLFPVRRRCKCDPAFWPGEGFAGLPAAERLWGKAFGGSPCFSRGELDFSPAEKRLMLKWDLAPGTFSIPALKRVIEVELSPERCSAPPRINAGASTQKYPPRELRYLYRRPVCRPSHRALQTNIYLLTTGIQ